MVLFSLVNRFNRWLGPVLLRYGIKARYAMAGGIMRDNTLADAVCFIPFAQKLIATEVYFESKAAIQAAARNAKLKSSVDAAQSSPKVSSNNTTADALDEASIRLRVLEQFLRPALISNEQWSDIHLWQFHSRILKWVRTEFLLAKYGPSLRRTLSDANPSKTASIRKSPQLTNGFFGRSTDSSKLASSSWSATFGPMDWLMGNRSDSNTDLSDTTVDPLKLVPYSAVLTKAFDMIDWEPSTKNARAIRKDMVRIAEKIGGSVIEIRGGSIGVTHVPDLSTDVSNMSIEEIIEVTGGHVMQCGPFNALCEHANIYQFWTREYIEQLGRYLLRQSAANPLKETIILDVGAGDGILADLLREFFASERIVASPTGFRRGRQHKSKGFVRRRKVKESDTTPSKRLPTIMASDDGTWGISPIAQVEKQTAEEALAAFAEKDANGSNIYHMIVICSWMPMNEDWTAVFRSHQVDEYILIGECDDGQCGDNWETWGNAEHLNDSFDVDLLSQATSQSSQSTVTITAATPVKKSDSEPLVPPYKVDGYDREDLDEFSAYQFSRFDCRGSKTGRTVSFRRRR
jgi:hypothetical protein